MMIGKPGAARTSISTADARAITVRRHDLATVAFPAISTGLFGFPADLAAQIAVDTVRLTLTAEPAFERVTLCCFSNESAEFHHAALEALNG